jgi:hypothetical protein
LTIPKSTDAATTTTSIKQPVDDRILTSFLNFFKSDRLLAFGRRWIPRGNSKRQAFSQAGSGENLRSADILSAVGRGTFCHPSSAQRLDGQHVRHPAARKMHALRHSESLHAK